MSQKDLNLKWIEDSISRLLNQAAPETEAPVFATPTRIQNFYGVLEKERSERLLKGKLAPRFCLAN